MQQSTTGALSSTRQYKQQSARSSNSIYFYVAVNRAIFRPRGHTLWMLTLRQSMYPRRCLLATFTIIQLPSYDTEPFTQLSICLWFKHFRRIHHIYPMWYIAITYRQWQVTLPPVLLYMTSNATIKWSMRADIRGHHTRYYSLEDTSNGSNTSNNPLVSHHPHLPTTIDSYIDT
jgi:hypothetical protein